MRRRKLNPEELCEALQRLENGTSIARLCEEYGVSAATLYAGRRLYSGLPSAVVGRLQMLAISNALLQKQVRDLMSDNRALRAALVRNDMSPIQRRELVTYLTTHLGVTHTKACKFAKISRSFFAYQNQTEALESVSRRRVIASDAEGAFSRR